MPRLLSLVLAFALGAVVDAYFLNGKARLAVMQTITPKLIESHYENNYGGAVTRLNAISEELAALDPANCP